ncbi:MAG: alcohol dehydrogenase, partial [Paraglaciecola sp.]
MASFTKFEFHTVADIRFGAGCLAELPALLLSKFKAKKVLLVTDQGLRRAGIIDSLLANLAAAKIDVQVFDQVIADPPESVILAAADKAKGVDLIIGMGGGSSMDTAKLAAVVCMD